MYAVPKYKVLEWLTMLLTRIGLRVIFPMYLFPLNFKIPCVCSSGLCLEKRFVQSISSCNYMQVNYWWWSEPFS